MTGKGAADAPQVVSIHIAEKGSGPMTPVARAHAVPGKGIEGDRYFLKTGTYSAKPGSGRQITFVELEAIEAVRRDDGVPLDQGETRRNIVTSGIALNHLVGREFMAGEVTLRGVRLCEPCDHLAKLTGKKVLPSLVHRGGLRADILTEGTIRTGDRISLIGTSSAVGSGPSTNH